MSARTPIDIDAALRDLAASLDMSPTPDYAGRVLPLLDGAPAGRVIQLHPRGVSRLLLAAAAVLLSALATTIAVPASRHALASWFGFSAIEIRTAPTTAPPPTLPPTSSIPDVPGAGKLTTLRAVRAASKDRLVLPSDLPRPSMVFEYEQGGATVLTLAYGHVAGLAPTPDTGFALLITEVFDAGHPILMKLLHNGASTERVDVNGAVGVYVSGPQEIMNEERTTTANGTQIVHEVAPRSSANTLIWAAGGVTYRLEGDFSRAAAVDLAHTIS